MDKEKNAAATEEKAAPQADPVKADNKDKDAKKRLKKLENEVAELKKQLDAAKDAQTAENDKYLRMMAEYDNFRKRTARERDNIYNDAYADALKALFPVVDNLTRAAQYTGGEEVAKGVAMTLQSVNDTLAKLGVVPVGKVGETFDPNLHNAVLHVEDETKGEGEIVEVLQAGYKRGDRVLRYAMVKVAN